MVAKNLTLGLQKLRGLNVPHEINLKKHVYYFYPMSLNKQLIKTDKKKIVYLLEKEGVQGICSEYGSLHLLPIFKKNKLKSKKLYSVAEELNNKTFIAIKKKNRKRKNKMSFDKLIITTHLSGKSKLSRGKA